MNVILMMKYLFLYCNFFYIVVNSILQKSDVGEIQIIVTQILDMTLHRKRIKNLKPWSSQLSTFNVSGYVYFNSY